MAKKMGLEAHFKGFRDWERMIANEGIKMCVKSKIYWNCLNLTCSDSMVSIRYLLYGSIKLRQRKDESCVDKI